MKKLVYLFIIAAVTLNLGGCKVINETRFVQYEDSSNVTETMYMGNNGWNVTYDEQFFDMKELTKGQDIELIYKGKCRGSAYVEIAEVDGKTAKELIDEKKSEFESTSEVYDAGKNNKSGYVFYVPDIIPSKEMEDDRNTTVEIIDLNHGALIITASQMMNDEIEVSDRISAIFNSIEVQ